MNESLQINFAETHLFFFPNITLVKIVLNFLFHLFY